MLFRSGEGTNITAYIVPESAVITESTTATASQFIQTALVAKKFAGFASVTNELLQDNIIGLQDLIARSVARDISLTTGTWFTTGAGSTVPYGFVTRATVAGTALGTADNTAKDSFFGPSDLVTAYYSLAAPYRANATFMVSTTALAKVRKFRDADNNFMFQVGVRSEEHTSELQSH